MYSAKSTAGAGLAGLVFLFSLSGHAAPFSEIRIGDIDGFGYGTGATSCPGGTCQAANGGPANVGVGGVLGAESLPTVGDFLPDLNGSGDTGPNSGDDFDNRSGETVSGVGFTDTGTSGTGFTDISLSESYDSASAAGEVYDANTGTRGTGGSFPAPPSATLPNQPGFEFRFDVAKSDIADGAAIFFNVVFADFGVTPFALDLTFADGTATSLDITPQNNREGEDGLIQASFAELAFGDVFGDGGTVYNGFLDVTFDAPDEPYTAYDFVELSTRPISTNVPVPATFLLFGLGLAGISLVLHKRRLWRG